MTRDCRRAGFAGEMLIVLFVAGCAHSNAPTSTQAAAPPASGADRTPVFGTAAHSVVLCKTTEADLRRQLGEPLRDGILHGTRVMSWIARWDAPERYLAVLLDDRGVVVDLYWDIPRELPWVPTDQCRGR